VELGRDDPVPYLSCSSVISYIQVSTQQFWYQVVCEIRAYVRTHLKRSNGFCKEKSISPKVICSFPCIHLPIRRQRRQSNVDLGQSSLKVFLYSYAMIKNELQKTMFLIFSWCLRAMTLFTKIRCVHEIDSISSSRIIGFYYPSFSTIR
jgi:hypothetical protein